MFSRPSQSRKGLSRFSATHSGLRGLRTSTNVPWGISAFQTRRITAAYSAGTLWRPRNCRSGAELTSRQSASVIPNRSWTPRHRSRDSWFRAPALIKVPRLPMRLRWRTFGSACVRSWQSRKSMSVIVAFHTGPVEPAAVADRNSAWVHVRTSSGAVGSPLSHRRCRANCWPIRHPAECTLEFRLWRSSVVPRRLYPRGSSHSKLQCDTRPVLV